MDDYIDKPVKMEELALILEKISTLSIDLRRSLFFGGGSNPRMNP
jgi:hypothetical protein